MITYVEFIHKFRWAVIVVGIIAILGFAYVGKDAFGGLHDGGFVPPRADSTTATTKLINSVGDPDYNDIGIIVLLESKDRSISVYHPEFEVEYNKVKTSLSKQPVRNIISFYDYPEQVRMISDDHMKALMYASIAGDISDNSDILKAISVSSLTARAGGGIIVGNELGEEILAGVKTAEFSTLPVIFFLLIFTLGSFTAGMTPWLICAFAIFGVLSSLIVLDYGFRMSSIATNVVTMFGLGLGIDYTLFIVSRFRIERRRHPTLHVTKIVQRTMETSGRTVTFSAVTVFLSLAGGLLFHEFFLCSMCLAVMLAAVFAAIASNTILMALLCVIDHNIFSCSTEWLTDWFTSSLLFIFSGAWITKGSVVCPSIPSSSNSEKKKVEAVNHNNPNNSLGNRNNSHKDDDANNVDKVVAQPLIEEDLDSGFWYSIGSFVLDHPIAVVSITMASIISLSVVFLVFIKFGITDPTVLHGASESRQVYVEMQTDFKYLGRSNLYIYLETAPGEVISKDFLTALDIFSAKLEKLDNVVNVVSMVRPGNYSYSLNEYIALYANTSSTFAQTMQSPLSLTDLDSHTYVEVALDLQAYSKTAKKMVRVVRNTLSSSFHYANGTKSYLVDSGVTGMPAIVKDLYNDLVETIPGWLSIMLGSIFILLMLMTGSLLIPLKAVILSVLSLGAAFGIIVIIFQMGYLSKELDFVATGYLDGSNLIFIFSVAFGLSVDYELFLISQIQEIYLKTGDTRKSVLRALQQTGSVITSAAIMLSLVTAAFLASTVSFIKVIGLGIAIAVMIDATIIRMLLVPATIVLFGSWNWYSPVFLKRFIELLGIQEPPDRLFEEYGLTKVDTADDLMGLQSNKEVNGKQGMVMHQPPLVVESLEEGKSIDTNNNV